MKFYGNIDMQENELQNFAFELETTTPTSTKAGRMLYKNNRLFIAAEISGSPVWVPLTKEFSKHTHTQSVASSTWSIPHNLSTDTPMVTVFDENDQVIIPNEITIVDDNNMTIDFSVAQAGKAVIIHGLESGDVADLLDSGQVASGFEVLVMNTDSTNGSTTFTDDTGNHTLTAVNGTQHSTTETKFGATSAFFDADAYINVSNTTQTDLGLSNQPFTVDMWVNFSADDTSYLLGKGGGTAGWNSTTGHQWFMVRASGLLYFQWYDGSFQVISGSFPISVGQWYHIAAVYDGSVIKLYIDGTEVSSSAASQTFVKPSSSNQMRIGANGVATEVASNAYIDSVRIEKGYVRYTEAFTPPTTPFPV